MNAVFKTLQQTTTNIGSDNLNDMVLHKVRQIKFGCKCEGLLESENFITSTLADMVIINSIMQLTLCSVIGQSNAQKN